MDLLEMFSDDKDVIEVKADINVFSEGDEGDKMYVVLEGIIALKVGYEIIDIVEAGDVIETHHFATLIGYGANAINPYLTLETLKSIKKTYLKGNKVGDLEAMENYKEAIGYGLYKIFSKMGISII